MSKLPGEAPGSSQLSLISTKRKSRPKAAAKHAELRVCSLFVDAYPLMWACQKAAARSSQPWASVPSARPVPWSGPG